MNSVLAGYISGSTEHLEAAGGDFIVGTNDPAGGHTISSTIGAHPWYYTVDNHGQLLQGPNVFDLCHAAKFAWEWNAAAIDQIALLGHTVGTHTLHRRIHRLPSGTRLSLHDRKAETSPLSPLAGWVWDREEIDQKFLSLKCAFDACISGENRPIISISAGYDSRLLLALCISKGLEPDLFVMGPPEATDSKIATLIARKLHRPVEYIPINAEDYLNLGEDISYTTSGVKAAEHWHTWIYSQQLNNANRVHLVGSNGEFARTFYNDVLTRSKIFRNLGRPGVRAYFIAKIINRARKYSKHLAVTARLRSVFRSLELDPAIYPRAFLPALDTFYAIERVRHFIGSGIACYAQFTTLRSPFLDGNWMRSVAATKRLWKEGQRYHLCATETLAPGLTEIPYNRNPDGGNVISYSPFATLVAMSATKELIIESKELEHFASRTQRIKILNGDRRARAADIALLLTIHFASINAHKASAKQAI